MKIIGRSLKLRSIRSRIACATNHKIIRWSDSISIKKLNHKDEEYDAFYCYNCRRIIACYQTKY